ncbi:MAG: glycine betaine/L-proline ABC transporter substrate-binding protein ProX [Acidimicrobiales bacterium]
MSVRRVLTLALMLTTILASCGSDSDTSADSPGAGVEVTMGRATWETGWFQAAVYSNLLERLGYEVSDPVELSPDDFYVAAANGEIDFWANGWFPGDQALLDQQVTGVGPVSESVQPVGFEVTGGAIQGLLVDTATVKEAGIATLGDIAGDPELVERFDIDGNGLADVLGCPADWPCASAVDELLAESDSGTLEQIKGDYETHVDLALGRLARGEPVMLYAWTPAATTAILDLGPQARWLDASPVGPGDAFYELAEVCTTASCRLGFAANDIRVVANTEFLDGNPAAATLFEVVQIPLSDIQDQNVAMARGADQPVDIERQAEEWLGSRRALVLDWLRSARAAGG